MFRAKTIGLMACVALAACGSHGDRAPGNAPPRITPQTFAGSEDTPLNGQLAATDPGDAISFDVVANPMDGTVAVTAAGAMTYSPNANFNGVDSFTARVTDSIGQWATATITMTVAGVNDPPSAANDVLAVISTDALDLLANDTDADGEALTVTIIGTPLVGIAIPGASGTVSLALPTGFKGFSSFRYRVTDAANFSSEATATVFVGIPPFKIVKLAPAVAGATRGGLMIDDLFSAVPAHEDYIGENQIDRAGLVFAENGSALAFPCDCPAGRELRYVDLTLPGTSRVVHGPVGATDLFGRVSLTADGRFLVYEYARGGGRRETYVFDARGSSPGQLLSRTTIGNLNAQGSAMYFVARDVPTLPPTTAVYRADLASRTVARLSIDTPAQSHEAVLPRPDDMSYIDIRREVSGRTAAYLTANSDPASATLMHEPSANPGLAGELSRDGAYFMFKEFNTSFTPVRLAIVSLAAPGLSRTVGGAAFTGDSILDPPVLRPDSQAVLQVYRDPVSLTSTIYEAALAAPETVTPVFQAPNGSTRFGNLHYSEDGERIVYHNNDFGGSLRAVNVTRRETLGQTVQVTPGATGYGAFQLDSSGYVVLAVPLVGPAGVASLINVDAPQLTFPAGELYDDSRTFAVLPR
jgi:hypothetical protein